MKNKTQSPPSAKGKSAYEQFMAMTPAQRTAEVSQYDREDLTPGKPLGAADKAIFRSAAARVARTKIGRPTVGRGAKIVPVSVERTLLEETDRYAKQHGLKRSQMVAEGLRLVMRRAAG